MCPKCFNNDNVQDWFLVLFIDHHQVPKGGKVMDITAHTLYQLYKKDPLKLRIHGNQKKDEDNDSVLQHLHGKQNSLGMAQ